MQGRGYETHQSGTNLPKVAIVIPTLNEEHGIGEVISEVSAAIVQYEFEVLVVDGHSKDRTREIAAESGAEVIFQKTRGYGDALRSGFLHAARRMKSDVIVMMDADLTYDPRDIPSLIEPLIQGETDLVVGNRFVRLQQGSMTRTNKFGNSLISWFARHTLGVKIHDTQCGLRAFKANLLEYLNLDAEGMPLALEMIADVAAARGSIAELPVSYRPRAGKTKLHPFHDGLAILGTLIRLVRDTKPLLFFLTASAAMGILGILFGVSVVQEYLRTGSVRKLPTLILSVLLLIGALQMSTVGLIADMLKRKRVRDHL